jgi:hypothetical protein
MAGNLGYETLVPLDATRTFDLATILADGRPVALSAEELTNSTSVNLQGGGFAAVTNTDRIVRRLGFN